MDNKVTASELAEALDSIKASSSSSGSKTDGEKYEPTLVKKPSSGNGAIRYWPNWQPPSTIENRPVLNRKPGSLTDPFRRGLSGAGVKRYLKNLSLGLSPEEARVKADIRADATSQGPERGAPKRRYTSPERGENKRFKTYNNEIPQATDRRMRSYSDGGRDRWAAQPSSSKPKLSEQKSSPAQKQGRTAPKRSSSLKVCVLESRYPKVRLTRNQLTAIEKGVLRAIIESPDDLELEPKLDGIFFKPGYLLIGCEDEGTVGWLEEVVKGIQPFEGAMLKLVKGEDIPKLTQIVIYLPKSEELEDEEKLKMIRVLNRACDTRKWTVLKKYQEGTGVRYILEIDEDSIKYIESKEMRIRFNYGSVTVRRMKRVHGSVSVAQEEDHGVSDMEEALIEVMEPEMKIDQVPGIEHLDEEKLLESPTKTCDL